MCKRKSEKMVQIDQAIDQFLEKNKTTEKVKIADLSNVTGLTRSAIFNSISKGRLKAEMIGDTYYVSFEDYKNYRSTLYSRKFSKVNGEPLYDTKNGEISLSDAAEYCKLKYSEFYYYMSRDLIKCLRKRYSLVFLKRDLDGFLVDLADYKACSRKEKIERYSQLVFAEIFSPKSWALRR